VAVHVTRDERLVFDQIRIPDQANVRQVWLFGGASPDQSRWFLYGDLLSEPSFHEFPYPD